MTYHDTSNFHPPYPFKDYHRRALGLLLQHADKRYHVREIARLTGTMTGTLPKELTRLADTGLLLNETVAAIDSLWGAEPDMPESDRLDVFIALVEVYEAQHHPITPPDPVAAILFRMEQQGITRKDLEPILGSRARVSEILNHKRALSLDMIRNLHNKLHIPLECLVGI